MAWIKIIIEVEFLFFDLGRKQRFNNWAYNKVMAKLEKGLGDYFRIPVLLKPIGPTPL